MPRRPAAPDPAVAALRRRIDAVDRELVRLLGRRRALVAEIAGLKRAHDLPLRDRARERALLEDRRALARELGIPRALVDAVFREVLASSRAHLATRLRRRR